MIGFAVVSPMGLVIAGAVGEEAMAGQSVHQPNLQKKQNENNNGTTVYCYRDEQLG